MTPLMSFGEFLLLICVLLWVAGAGEALYRRWLRRRARGGR